MKLSVIIPVFNERDTIIAVIDRVMQANIGYVEKELVIVDDFSNDGTREILESIFHKDIRILFHEKNCGKGKAIRTALDNVNGDIVIIQDADLEYDPNDYGKLLVPILENRADVVYGSRMLGKKRGFVLMSHYYGNRFLTFLTALIYGKGITDMETCYKLMRREIARGLDLKSNKFDIEPEITAKILKKGYRIVEVPINYNARRFAEGKEITWKDGIMAILTLFRYRFFD